MGKTKSIKLMMRIFIYFFLCSISFCTYADNAKPTVVLGISEFAPGSMNTPIIGKTVEVLSKALPDYDVIAVSYSVHKLQEAVLEKKIDLVLSSAGFYRKLLLMGAGLRDLATVSSERFPNPNYSDGSVFITKNTNTQINDLKDLRGVSVAANHTYAFSGWQTALREIDKNGYDPDNFFGHVVFKGHEMGEVVKALDDGEVEAVILKTCFLEDNGYDLSRYKVIHRHIDNRFTTCLNSTELYPNWTLSTMPDIDPEVSRRVNAALLAMDKIQSGLHWGIATDFRGIDELFYRLKIGPYEYLRHFSISRFLEQYKDLFIIVITVFLLLLWHAYQVRILANRRTQQLRKAIKRQKKLQREASQIAEKFSEVQKAGVINQMSSILAHEIRQPLGSISTFSYALLRGLDRGDLNPEKLRSILEKLVDQSQRASLIIEKIRNYAKSNRKRTLIDIGEVVVRSINDLKKTTKYSGQPIYVNASNGLIIRANELEIELIVVNLIKNATEATEFKEPVIVDVGTESDLIKLKISDSGKFIDDKIFENIINGNISSSKSNGFGLGLATVRNLVEELGGMISFNRNGKKGLIVEIYLPKVSTDE